MEERYPIKADRSVFTLTDSSIPILQKCHHCLFTRPLINIWSVVREHHKEINMCCNTKSKSLRHINHPFVRNYIYSENILKKIKIFYIFAKTPLEH